MNKLRAIATARNNQIRVYINRSEEMPVPIAIDVPLDPASRENMIIAELVAMQHALSVLGYSGNLTQHGIGLALTFSYGAIRKLARKDSAFAHLSPYAQFICTRYQAAEIKIENRLPAWATDELVTNVYELDSKPGFETVSGEQGTFVVTAHTVERVAERNISSSLAKSFQVISNHFASEHLVPMIWDKDALKRCRAKYGKTSRLMYHTMSRTMYVVVTDRHHPHPVIVTAYTVREQYMSYNGVTRVTAA